jgi:hypothetical protein
MTVEQTVQIPVTLQRSGVGTNHARAKVHLQMPDSQYDKESIVVLNLENGDKVKFVASDIKRAIELLER